MTGFVKIYGSIIMSSVWEESPPTKVVWMTMLALADPNGYVGASRKALATMSRVTIEQLDEAIECFMSPDTDSRSTDYEGRRIEKVDRGWMILNYTRFREMRTETQIKKAKAQQKWRKKKKRSTVDNVERCSGHESAEEEEEEEEEILNYIPENAASGSDSQVSNWEKLSKKFMVATTIEHKNTPSMKTWGRQLKAFAKREDIKYTRIKKVMRWYGDQFDKESNPSYWKYLPKYTPRTTSMSGFTRKFFDIEIAMLKESPEKETVPVIQLNKQEQRCHDNMLSSLVSTPRMDEDTLTPLAKALSLQLNTAHKIIDTNIKDDKMREFWKRELFSRGYYIIEYAMWIKDEVNRWEHWSGDLTIFKPGGKHFTRFIKGVINRRGFGNDPIIRRILDEA